MLDSKTCATHSVDYMNLKGQHRPLRTNQPTNKQTNTRTRTITTTTTLTTIIIFFFFVAIIIPTKRTSIPPLVLNHEQHSTRPSSIDSIHQVTLISTVPLPLSLPLLSLDCFNVAIMVLNGWTNQNQSLSFEKQQDLRIHQSSVASEETKCPSKTHYKTHSSFLYHNSPSPPSPSLPRTPRHVTLALCFGRLG